MVSSSALLSMLALASTYLTTASAADAKPLPWDGRANDLTVETLSKKYLTHIFTMRNVSTRGVADYVSIEPEGRLSAYNGDKGVINIAVDDKAIFKAQTNFRRSELVQNIAIDATEVTFFRASMMMKTAFLNSYQWQCFFTESHIFELRVDVTQSPPKIMYLNNKTYEAKWEAVFEVEKWYNFGIALSAATSGGGSVLAFYTSVGEEDLTLVATHEVVSEFTLEQELHLGLLTLSDDGKDPKMNAKPDVISYSGVSVENKVVTSATVEIDGTSTPTTKSGTKPSLVKGSDGCATK